MVLGRKKLVCHYNVFVLAQKQRRFCQTGAVSHGVKEKPLHKQSFSESLGKHCPSIFFPILCSAPAIVFCRLV